MGWPLLDYELLKETCQWVGVGLTVTLTTVILYHLFVENRNGME